MKDLSIIFICHHKWFKKIFILEFMQYRQTELQEQRVPETVAVGATLTQTQTVAVDVSLSSQRQ